MSSGLLLAVMMAAAACRTPCESSFDLSGPMAEAVLLGTVALQNPGKTLEWDSQAIAFTNSAVANSKLRRSYRDGWKIEGLG